ncbi:MAG: hypothetical protein HY561_11360 [Gemmatimonadetes bacterium]|nr:hypothetical protein [Gemmatimonadota bacterium]
MPDAVQKNGRPAGSLTALLDELARRIAVEAVDELWIFPPHRVGSHESTVIVVSAFDGGGERRRVLTAHFTSRRETGGQAQLFDVLTEHGTAPAALIGRVVDGVLRRLGDDLAGAPPRAASIAGDAGRWSALREQLAGDPLPAVGGPSIRLQDPITAD